MSVKVASGIEQLLDVATRQLAIMVLGVATAAISAFAKANEAFAARLTLVPTTEVIGFDESPTAAYKKKKDSSLVRAFNAVKAGEADCVVSAGSTGALLTGATLTLRRQKGVKRPALATMLPTLTDGAVLLLVVDGRQVGYSLGATMGDCADILEEYGAVNAGACDGGSSSVLAYEGEILNEPSTNMPTGRYLPNAWVVARKTTEQN